jgi:hypothetical protein
MGNPESKIDHELLHANDAIKGVHLMNPADFRAIDVIAGGRLKIGQKARECPVLETRVNDDAMPRHLMN